MEKTAIETSDFLKWILGAALVGGGTRALFGLANQISPFESGVTPGDVSNEEVTVPVNLTQQQMARYRQLEKQHGLKGASEKTAGPWDNFYYTLGGMGGAGLGWWLASKIMKRMKDHRLSKELKKTRDELATLSDMPMSDEEDEFDGQEVTAGEKTAVIRDWLHNVALNEVGHHDDWEKTAGIRDALGRLAQKIRGGVGGAGDWLSQRATGRGIHRNFPLVAGAGLTGGLGAAYLAPGIGSAISRMGDAASGIAGGVGKSVLKPIGYTAAAVLGPIAALFGVMSFMRSLKKGRGASRKRQELKELRRQFRRGEAIESPYVRLKARQAKKKKEEEGGPVDVGLNTAYGKEAHAVLDKLAAVMFNPVADQAAQAGEQQNPAVQRGLAAVGDMMSKKPQPQQPPPQPQPGAGVPMPPNAMTQPYPAPAPPQPPAAPAGPGPVPGAIPGGNTGASPAMAGTGMPNRGQGITTPVS